MTSPSRCNVITAAPRYRLACPLVYTPPVVCELIKSLSRLLTCPTHHGSLSILLRYQSITDILLSSCYLHSLYYHAPRVHTLWVRCCCCCSCPLSAAAAPLVVLLSYSSSPRLAFTISVIATTHTHTGGIYAHNPRYPSVDLPTLREVQSPLRVAIYVT